MDKDVAVWIIKDNNRLKKSDTRKRILISKF